MRVIGLLSFYDEKPDHLTAAVGSLVTAGVDHLLAVDGAYGLYPHPQPVSPPECHDAIRDATGDVGFTLHVPAAPWVNNEIEKRTTMFRLAHALAEPYDDWLFVLDADEVIVESDGWRERLEQCELDVAAILHGEPDVRPRSARRLFRAHPRGIRVERAHYLYFDGDGRCLWGLGQIPRKLLTELRVLHRPRERTPERHAGRNQYYEDRKAARAEVEF